VNYLAHAWVLPPGASPDLVLGAALPDLLGAFDRRAPRLTWEAAARLEAAGARDLARGVRAHQVADACFHDLAAFREACDDLRPLTRALGEAGARVRGFFLAHLLVELLLDAELALRATGLAPGFYEAVAGADRTGAARVAAAAAGSPRDEAGWLRFTDWFVEARFLLDYATDAGVVRRVDQVLGRVRQSLGPGGRERLERELPEVRARLRALTPALVEPPREAVRRLLAE
jgi:hypothetical protein